MPVDHLGHDSAEQEAQRPARGSDEAKTPIAFARSRGCGNIRHDLQGSDGRGQRAADPLHEAGGDQQSLALGQAAQQRRGRESARPDMKRRLRPIRSPRRPASRSKPPNVIRYALTTQARFGRREAEVGLDQGQRDVHHGGPERSSAFRSTAPERDPLASGLALCMWLAPLGKGWRRTGSSSSQRSRPPEIDMSGAAICHRVQTAFGVRVLVPARHHAAATQLLRDRS